MVTISIGILRSRASDNVLIARRSDTGPWDGYWELPGGKVEEGETPEQAVVREYMEELNIAVEVTSEVEEGPFKIPGMDVMAHVFFLDCPNYGDMELRVHSAFADLGLKDIKKGLDLCDLRLTPGTVMALDRAYPHEGFCALPEG